MVGKGVYGRSGACMTFLFFGLERVAFGLGIFLLTSPSGRDWRVVMTMMILWVGVDIGSESGI